MFSFYYYLTVSSQSTVLIKRLPSVPLNLSVLSFFFKNCCESRQTECHNGPEVKYDALWYSLQTSVPNKIKFHTFNYVHYNSITMI